MQRKSRRLHDVLEQKLRALGRGFTAHDVHELYGCQFRSAYKLLYKWEREGKVVRTRLAYAAQTGRSCAMFEFTDTSGVTKANN